MDWFPHLSTDTPPTPPELNDGDPPETARIPSPSNTFTVTPTEGEGLISVSVYKYRHGRRKFTSVYADRYKFTQERKDLTNADKELIQTHIDKHGIHTHFKWRDPTGESHTVRFEKIPVFTMYYYDRWGTNLEFIGDIDPVSSSSSESSSSSSESSSLSSLSSQSSLSSESSSVPGCDECEDALWNEDNNPYYCPREVKTIYIDDGVGPFTWEVISDGSGWTLDGEMILSLPFEKETYRGVGGGTSIQMIGPWETHETLPELEDDTADPEITIRITDYCGTIITKTLEVWEDTLAWDTENSTETVDDPDWEIEVWGQWAEIFVIGANSKCTCEDCGWSQPPDPDNGCLVCEKCGGTTIGSTLTWTVDDEDYFELMYDTTGPGVHPALGYNQIRAKWEACGIVTITITDSTCGYSEIAKIRAPGDWYTCSYSTSSNCLIDENRCVEPSNCYHDIIIDNVYRIRVVCATHYYKAEKPWSACVDITHPHCECCEKCGEGFDLPACSGYVWDPNAFCLALGYDGACSTSNCFASIRLQEWRCP